MYLNKSLAMSQSSGAHQLVRLLNIILLGPLTPKLSYVLLTIHILEEVVALRNGGGFTLGYRGPRLQATWGPQHFLMDLTFELKIRFSN